jgi:hypothetical protein
MPAATATATAAMKASIDTDPFHLTAVRSIMPTGYTNG